MHFANTMTGCETDAKESHLEEKELTHILVAY